MCIAIDELNKEEAEKRIQEITKILKIESYILI